MSQALIQALFFARFADAFNILLNGKYNIHARTVDGRTAMHLAAGHGNVAMLKRLTNLGFDRKVIAKNGMTPLHYAVIEQRLEATELLLSWNLNVNCADKQRMTPLHYAVRYNTSHGTAISKALLRAKTDPNALDRDNQSPLHKAVLANAFSQIRLLVQTHGIAIFQDKEDKKPVHYARENDFTRIQAFLDKEYNDLTASDTDSEDLVDYEFSDEQDFDEAFLLSGSLDGEVLHFQESSIIGNNECAFIGLGTDRTTLTNELRHHLSDNLRESMWEEVADAILTEKYSPPEAEEMLTKFYSKHDDHPEPLKTFCLNSEVFLGYLSVLADPEQALWLGYQGAIAYATLKNIQLYIWTKNEDQTLTLAKRNTIVESAQTIHLLHTDSYTHFNLLIQNTALTDTDKITQRLGALSLDPSKKTDYVIPHFRGIHFYKEYFTRKQRKQSIEVHRQQNAGDLPRIGLFSSATYEVAQCSLILPENINEQTLTTLDQTLDTANQQVISAMQALQAEKRVTPCLGRGNASRDEYSSRYIEFVQRYVNSYQTLMDDMHLAPTKKIDGRTSQVGKKKWNILKKLKLTKLPLLSTSESLYWGLEYATALLNWDKANTHQPRQGTVAVHSPCYSSDGHPRFPYLGILYVTLHSNSQLTDEISTRILDLFSENEIDTKCSSPGGHLKGGYLKARERVFIGGIKRDCVKLSLVIRVPSFYFTYRPFIEKKYGINEQMYNKFRNDLRAYGTRSGVKGSENMRNPLAFHRTEQSIIEFVIHAQCKIIEQKIVRIAAEENTICQYLGVESGVVQNTLPELEVLMKKRDHRSLK